MGIKVTASLLACFCFVFLCTGCRNTTTHNEGKQSVADYDFIDTSICETNVERIAQGDTAVFKSTTIFIENRYKPRLEITLSKGVINKMDKIGLAMSFTIDSPICTGNGNYITFYFADKSEFKFRNGWDSLCDGVFYCRFTDELHDISKVEADADIEKVTLNKIQAIKFGVRGGYREYILCDRDASLLRDYINCIRKAE